MLCVNVKTKKVEAYFQSKFITLGMGNENRCDVEGILFWRAVITELSYPADFISVVETFSSGWCMSTESHQFRAQ